MANELPSDLQDRYNEQVHPHLKAFVDAADGLIQNAGANGGEALAPLHELVGHVKKSTPFIMWHPGS